VFEPVFIKKKSVSYILFGFVMGIYTAVLDNYVVNVGYLQAQK